MSAPVDTFLTNLKLLGFDQTVHCKGTSVIVDQNIFTLNANNTKAFEIISHFLFRSLDRVKTRTIFKHVWPPKTKQQSREYLNISFRWLEEIKYKCLLKHTPLRKSYFEDCRGEVMNKIMMAFSTHVLEQVLLTKKNIDILPLENMDKELLELKIQELGKELLEKESNIDNSRKRWSQEGQDIISQLSSRSPKRQKTSNKSASPSSFSEVNYRLYNTANNILQQKQERERQRQEIEEREMQEHLERERQYLEEQRLKQEKLERERLEQERLEQERVKQECLMKERAEQERREKERVEKERAEQELLRQKRLEEERLERERQRAEREKLEQERQRLEEERLEQQRKNLEQEGIEQQKREEQRREERRREEQRLEEEKLKQQKLEEQKREQQRLEEQLEEIKREQEMLEEQLREQRRLEEQRVEQQRIEEREHQRLQEEMIEKQREEERLKFEKLEKERVELHRLEKHKFEFQKLEKMKHDRQMLEQQKPDEQQELEELQMLNQYQKSPRSQTMQYSPACSSQLSPSIFSQSSPSRVSKPSPSRLSRSSFLKLSQSSPSRRSKTPRLIHLRKPFSLRQKLLEILRTPAEVNNRLILPPLPKSPPSDTWIIAGKEQEELNSAFSPGRSIKRRSLSSLGTASKASTHTNDDPMEINSPKASAESNYDPIEMEITSPSRHSIASKRSALSPFAEGRKGFLMSPSRTTSLNNSLLTNRDSYSPLASTKKPLVTPPSSLMERISSKQKTTITPSASSLFVESSSSNEASFISTTRSSPICVSNDDSSFMVTKTSPISPLRSVSVNESLSSLSYEREPISTKQTSPFGITSKTTTVDAPTRPSAAYEPLSPRRATLVRESIFSKQAPASPHRPIISSLLRSTSVYEPESRVPLASPYSSRLSKETVLSPSRSTEQSSSPTVTPKRVVGSPARSTHTEPRKVFASPMRPTLRGIDDEDDDMCLQGMESVISIRLEEPPWTPMTTSYSPGDVYVDLNAKTPITRNLYRYNE